MAKIIVIDSCKDCPHSDIESKEFGDEYKKVRCRLQENKVVQEFKRRCRIGQDCPLEDEDSEDSVCTYCDN